MDYEQLFDRSFERCRGRDDREPFFESFYNRYLQTDQRVANVFAHTDMLRQQSMLEKSFYRLLIFYVNNSADDYIEQIAVRHNRQNLNITPDLYDLWLQALIDTVADYDPLFDDSTELAWRLVLSSGITYMKFKYDH